MVAVGRVHVRTGELPFLKRRLGTSRNMRAHQIPRSRALKNSAHTVCKVVLFSKFDKKHTLPVGVANHERSGVLRKSTQLSQSPRTQPDPRHSLFSPGEEEETEH